MRISEPRLVI
ncbi:hypothetical protein LINPERHAP1_LOCUS21296 [Linum perenne]